LRTKGEPIKISEQAIKANAIEEGRTDASGNVVEEEKPKPDPVDKAIQLRLKGGSLTNVVASKEKNDEVVFKLKLKGGQPKISEARKDPNEAMANAFAEKEADQLKLQKTPCTIDMSLQERIKAGSI
jgi:myo-inositol-hexaphosphate 3-phosphohydrolase